MDEERQETADWRIVWQMFFPCVISDLIGGCVEVLGHLNGNMGRIVSSLLTVVLLAEDPEKERKQAHSRGRRDERAGLSTDKDDKGREKWIFLGKNAGCVENPAGGSCVQRCV